MTRNQFVSTIRRNLDEMAAHFGLAKTINENAHRLREATVLEDDELDEVREVSLVNSREVAYGFLAASLTVREMGSLVKTAEGEDAFLISAEAWAALITAGLQYYEGERLPNSDLNYKPDDLPGQYL